MLIKQLSIFVENKPGRLCAITNILKENSIDIRAMSIADTKDFGILRLIVNNPEKAEKALKDAQCTVSISSVIAISIEDRPGSLADAIEALHKNYVSVEYMYAFLSKTENIAHVILRVDNEEAAVEALNTNSVTILTSGEIYED